MRRTLKLLLLLGIASLFAKDKDGGITPGNGDNTIDPTTGKPKTDEQRKKDTDYKGTSAQEDFDGVMGAADKESQAGRGESAESNQSESPSETSEDTDSDGQTDTTVEDGPWVTDENLEGKVETIINDPNNPGETITDIDRVEDGVLWEEKSAVWAGNHEKWVNKQIQKKFESYLLARQYMKGYQDAPIGFSFTEPGVDPALKSAIEARIAELQAQHPDVDIRLEWSE